jgi:hypothetical protein
LLRSLCESPGFWPVSSFSNILLAILEICSILLASDHRAAQRRR